MVMAKYDDVVATMAHKNGISLLVPRQFLRLTLQSQNIHIFCVTILQTSEAILFTSGVVKPSDRELSAFSQVRPSISEY